jgi:NAD-dependent SIR2 family protein deacetylase
MPVMRIPYTDPLPAPRIIPASASSLSGAIAAVAEFLTTPAPSSSPSPPNTVLLTGAGISVASGLADYRGTNGTYTLNKTYRPIYYNEFTSHHSARKRYWARSYLGWPNLERARPNSTHHAIGELGRLGLVKQMITQNVDSFHPHAHPDLPTIELHGYLRATVCLSCRQEYDRTKFQKELSRLNPQWHEFLQQMLDSGALTTEDPHERKIRGLRTNPDGDVDVGNVDYTTFKYPPCPACLEKPPELADGSTAKVEVEKDGAWSPASSAGVLKPAVIMFGESIPATVKLATEAAIDQASKILVVGSSLATYSAWRLVKRAKEQGMSIGILNLGGVRGEAQFFAEVSEDNTGKSAVRASQYSDHVLPEVVKIVQELQSIQNRGQSTAAAAR